MKNEDELHQMALDLMLEIDQKYNRETMLSLDDYLAEFSSTLSEEEKAKINSLLMEFYS